jgi:hypothetical protein
MVVVFQSSANHLRLIAIGRRRGKASSQEK